MSLNQQFIEYYETLSDDGRSSLLTALRQGAKKVLQSVSLPQTGEESYQRFDITSVLRSTLELAPSTESIQQVKDLQHRSCYLDLSIETITVQLINGQVFTPQSQGQAYFLGSIYDFERAHTAIASQYIGSMLSLQSDPLSALNTLLMSDALVLYLPKGIHVDHPIHILRRTATMQGQCLLTSPRIVVIAEEQSSAQLLLCDHVDYPDTPVFSNALVEIYAAAHSHIECYDIEETSTLTTRLHSTHIHQEADSNVLLNTLTILNGRTRNNYYCCLSGKKAELNLDGLAILDGEQQADNYSIIQHAAPDCHSDELFKYTLNDKSRGAFSGLIHVHQVAQQTLAYQNNRNLLLSSNARMYSKPQLEIYADDVRCSHGLTTGELDQKALFYLQQRGISASEARLMLIVAFMSNILDKVAIDELRERLVDVVDKRYRGLPSTCS